MKTFDIIIAVICLIIGLLLFFFPTFEFFRDIEFQNICLSMLFMIVSGLIIRTRNGNLHLKGTTK